MKKEAISHQVKALTFTVGLGIGAKNEQAAFWARYIHHQIIQIIQLKAVVFGILHNNNIYN